MLQFITAVTCYLANYLLAYMPNYYKSKDQRERCEEYMYFINQKDKATFLSNQKYSNYGNTASRKEKMQGEKGET